MERHDLHQPLLIILSKNLLHGGILAPTHSDLDHRRPDAVDEKQQLSAKNCISQGLFTHYSMAESVA